MGQILFDGTAGREVRQEQLGQGDAENEDPHLGIHKAQGWWRVMWAEEGVCGRVVTEELGKVAVGGPEGQAKEVGLCFVSNGMLALNFKMPAIKRNGMTHICLSLFYNAGCQDSHGSPLSPCTSGNRQGRDC